MFLFFASDDNVVVQRCLSYENSTLKLSFEESCHGYLKSMITIDFSLVRYGENDAVLTHHWIRVRRENFYFIVSRFDECISFVKKHGWKKFGKYFIGISYFPPVKSLQNVELRNSSTD